MRLPAVRSYPKEIIVNNEVYALSFTRRVNKDGRLGECNPSEREIKIKLGMSASETFATFIHEVLHAIEFEYNLNISHGNVYKLEAALTDLFLQNF